MQTSLISNYTTVESPFIIIKIGDYTFGHCQFPKDRNKLVQYKVDFPNYVNSMQIKKVNGSINNYTIKLTYAITPGDDPNMFDKVFSSVSESRKIFLQYGDWNIPNHIYKDEEALLTKVSSNIDFANSKIDYTLTAVSNALSITAVNHNFEARVAQPSAVIIDLLNDESYNLKEVFPGMANLSAFQLASLIDHSDKTVSLNAQYCSIFTYINYLVSCMTYIEDSDSDIKSSRYYWATYDDLNNEYGGSYFKIVRVDARATYNLEQNCYEVDIGYPSGNFVTNFTVDTNESWSILYNYSVKMNMPTYTYDIDNKGNISANYSPMILNSSNYGTIDEFTKAWWSNMTMYPISAKLTIKGLLKPALLMSYVKINTYFYGNKHISSGLYIITKQEDTIDTNGYRTTLSITRVSGDEM